MYLVRLIYASKITPIFKAGDVDSILSASHRNNPGRGVTGMLCFDNTYFLQALEGSRQAVSELFGRISADPRHMDVTMLQYSDIAERDFGAWDMAYAALSPSQLRMLKNFGVPDSGFDPMKMSGASAHALLLYGLRGMGFLGSQ